MHSRSAGQAERPTARRAPLRLAACLGALAVAFAAGSCSPIPAQSGAPPPAFDEARAWKDLERIVAIGPRPSGSPGAEATRAYLEAQLGEAGLKPVRETFREKTPAGELEFANVYADVAPRKGPADAPWILFCAHYDTKRLQGTFVGANDGGSGTALLLELARTLAKAPGEGFGYRFLFLDGEESVNAAWVDPDNRYGSRHHAAALKASGRAGRYRACVLFDMVGDKDLRIEQEGYSDARLYAVFARSAAALSLSKHFAAQRGQPISDDHLSFLAVGIRSVDLIDFDYGPSNAYWHTSEDTLEHCSKASLGIVGRVVVNALPALEQHLSGL